MPTNNRRQFIVQAIKYFQRQDYPKRELIIVDDGSDLIKDLIPKDDRIIYIAKDYRIKLGEKRNMACKVARGEIIVHWDDDDWMADWRLQYQVESLLRDQVDICGLNKLLFYNPALNQTWQYVYPDKTKPWVAGGSLCYTKVFWSRNPFPNINVGEDNQFVWSRHSKKIALLQDKTFYVALIHKGNSSPKYCRGSRWSRWHGDLKQIMGDDIFYYQDRTKRLKPSGSTSMKLNLGCCDNLLPGFVNVDIVQALGVEVVDLKQKWPWQDNSIDHIRAMDIIEHLPDKIFTMNELWRVTKAGGRVEIAVPTTDGTGAWQDPTHVSFWNRRSFLYYEAGNPYRERFASYYGIQAKFRVISERAERTQDGPRLTIVLQVVKP